VSAENVQLVKDIQPSDVDLVELFGAAAESELPFTAEEIRFTDDFHVEFVSATPGTARPTFRGFSGLLEGWRDWLEPYSSYQIRAEQFIDAGDEVVVMIRVQGVTARDGVSVEHCPAGVWTVRDGELARLRLYLERNDALADVASSRSLTSSEGEGVSGDSRGEFERQ
jgi:ketosteroid isomerase-like protein